MPNFKTEIAIVGGGICGLWILNLLRDRGYNACLLERSLLGNAQTLASQGMIHGGIKYALGGFTTLASESIANMPAAWRDCMNAKGSIDLSGLPVLSDDYYLFSDGALGGRITAFFASKSLRGRVSAVRQEDRPEAFSHKSFKGHLYKLQDMVIDTTALVNRLVERHRNHIFHAEAAFTNQGESWLLKMNDGSTLHANRYIFAAGEGNDELIAGYQKKINKDQGHSGVQAKKPISMQRRPLKQVMVKGDLPKMFAHAVSLKDANKPRLTITTHPMPDGENVWYLGGNLAEQGVTMSDQDLVAKAKVELKALIPWVDISAAAFQTLDVNRAEPAQESGSRPDFPYVESLGETITCWPTKLTLTPMLGDEVLTLLPPPSQQSFETLQLPLAKVSPSPWELAFG